jgi:hypothetical protein
MGLARRAGFSQRQPGTIVPVAEASIFFLCEDQL